MDNTSPRVSSRVKQIQEQKIITSNTNNNSVKTETKVLSSTRQLKKQTSNSSGITSAASSNTLKSLKKLIPNGSTTPDKIKTEVSGENHKKILFGSGEILNSGLNSDRDSDSELKIDSPGSDSMAPTISLKTPELKRENSNSLPGTDKTEKPTRWVDKI